ncbi:ABC transporter ATP-binding protein [Micromonospora sp. NPDC050980]|uniref:ABC transporter ATP-binding protein n=1 Tax=Micromonospora sp. NPDC050980 TaxID=3155161 RepID=UPI0033C16816
MTRAAITTTGLRKEYQYGPHTIKAVDGIDLSVGEGEFFGLLGPNGAGKSTTIGMLTTRIRPTGGSASVAGIDVLARPVEVRRRVAVVTQRNTMDRQISVAENLEFRGRYFGMGRREARRRAMELLTEFDIADKAGASLDEVSGGQARRAMICRAIMHRPDVLVLDEPSAGVDPQTRLHLWDLLRRLHADGQTVLLTTHHLDEAESLCQRIAVIDHGRVVAAGGIDEIKSAAGAESVTTVVFTGDAGPAAETASKIGYVTRVEVEGSRMRVHATQTTGLIGELAAAGADQGLSIQDVSTLRPSLETAFLNLTGREYRQ